MRVQHLSWCETWLQLFHERALFMWYIMVSFDVDVFNRIRHMQREVRALNAFILLYHTWLQLVFEVNKLVSRRGWYHFTILHYSLSSGWTLLFIPILLHDEQGRISDLNCLVKRFHAFVQNHLFLSEQNSFFSALEAKFELHIFLNFLLQNTFSNPFSGSGNVLKNTGLHLPF